MLQIASFVITFVALVIIFKSRKYEQGLSTLVPVSLFNIPLVSLGNSASAGIFPIDIIVWVFLLRFFVLSKSRSIFTAYQINSTYLLTILVCYALLRGIYVVLFDDYQYYDRFILYGMYRWLFFLYIFLIFIRIYPGENFDKLLCNLSYVLIIYFSFAIVHQLGIVDLSGWSATGYENVYEIEYLFKDVSRAFLGNNAATIGCISMFGILLGLLIYKSRKNVAQLILLLALISFIGCGSRSDFVGAIFALIVWFICFGTAKYLMIIIKSSIVLLVLGLFISGLSDYLYGFNRLLETDFIGEASGQSEGTFAYRVYWWEGIIEHFLDDVFHLFFGYGPNGFRMLSVNKISQMGFGHNV